jgi:hypothetical protein
MCTRQAGPWRTPSTVDRALRDEFVLEAFQVVEGAFDNTTFESICKAAKEQQLHTAQ